MLSHTGILCRSTTLKQLFVQSASSRPSDPSAMAFISLFSSPPSFLSIVSNYPLVIANQITVGALRLLTERVLVVQWHIQLMFCAPLFTVLLHAVIFAGTSVPSVFRRARKIAETDYLFRQVCLSVRPYGTTGLPLSGFFILNFIFECFFRKSVEKFKT